MMETMSNGCMNSFNGHHEVSQEALSCAIINGSENLFVEDKNVSETASKQDKLTDEVSIKSDDAVVSVTNAVENGCSSGTKDEPPFVAVVTGDDETGNKNEEAKDEDEDIPLIQLRGKSVDVHRDTPEKLNIGLREASPGVTPFSNIRGRSGLRGGSPLNTSFTVRSEPSSPNVLLFPRLRKAEGKLSLLSPRKRPQEEQSDLLPQKRQCQSGLTASWLRWWRGGEDSGDAEEPIDASSTTAPNLLAEAPSASSTSPRSCSIM